jgi:polyphenol oxidase
MTTSSNKNSKKSSWLPTKSNYASRRQFLVRTGLTVGGIALANAPHELAARNETPHVHDAGRNTAKAFSFGNEPPRQRKSFYDLTDDELRDLCLAVGYMRNGSAPDQPLSIASPMQWDQYVMIHAQHCTEAASTSEQVHWSWFFLPWHRGYLFFLERTLANILSKLGRHESASKFALPYWDWITHKEIPNTKARIDQGKVSQKGSPLFGYDLALENMVTPDGLTIGGPNGVKFDNQALWDGYRGPSVTKPEMNPDNEDTLESKEHVEETILFMSLDYIKDFLLNLPFDMFAGFSTVSPQTGMGALEHYPHNNGHDWVGSRLGKNRDMGSLRYAALDPIFFMHHANIDRIWSWYRKPQPDPDMGPWGEQQYTFRDVDGSPATVTVRDIVKKMTNVEYLPPASSTNEVKAFLGALPAAVEEAPIKKSETIVEKSDTLTDKPLTLKGTFKSGAQALLKEDAPESKNTFYVLEVQTGPVSYAGKFTIKLFANKTDADDKTSIKDPHYIGRISALDSESRLNEAGSAVLHTFVIILGRKDSNFFKVASPTEPFSITMVPAGSAKLSGFKIEVKSISLTAISNPR